MTDKLIYARSIRSYVVRKGRMTPGQHSALQDNWPQYGLKVVSDQDFFQWPKIFKRQAPLNLEIGFGMGDSLVAMAQQLPDQDFIGIEVHPPGMGACLAKARAAGLKNLKVFAQDAFEVLKSIPPESLDKIWLLFPDPWPKQRHHKRRMVQPEFAVLIANKLKIGGQFHMATDWQPYADHMLAVLEACPLLQNIHGARQFAPNSSARLPTKFEKRGLQLGHKIFDLIYTRFNLPSF